MTLYAITPRVQGGMLVFLEGTSDIGPGTMYCGIPLKYARMIKANMEKGMDYISASPMMDITREQAAIILCTPWDVLRGK